MYKGKPLTKTAQIKLAGNSVCVDVAAILVAANMRGGGESSWQLPRGAAA
jgi:hypothetical protein